MSTCAKCLKEKDNVNIYGFYYGKKIGEETIDKFRSIETKTTYRMTPLPKNVYICDDCINKKRTRNVLLLLLFLVLLFSGLSFGIVKENSIIIWISSLGMVISIILVSIYSKQKMLGDQIAINLFREKLMQQGYDSFFTRDEHSGKVPKM